MDETTTATDTTVEAPAEPTNPLEVSAEDFAQVMQTQYPKESELVILRIQNARMQALLTPSA